MKRVNVFLFFVLFSLSLSAQKKVMYAYDAAGNRIKKEILFEQSQSKSQVVACSDMLDEKEIKIYPNPTEGELRVEIFNELKKTEGIVTVHGNNGAMIYTTPIINGSASLDISSCPNGLYILHVKIGDCVSSWKIIKR
ncbi:MAG: T9SS C-terminal target domain-containing protein [Prevotella sp.]|jgi:hypothetical protein|nr:T9SS C-terminal target domain-containing protein [Prevotella sp.]